MGIHAQIYDSASGRDSLSVWPQDTREVLVLNAEGPFERKPGQPAVVIVPGYGGVGTVRAAPVDDAGNEIRGVMKGYSYIGSSDSRFGALVERVINERVQAQYPGAPRQRFYGAVALHDRLEP